MTRTAAMTASSPSVVIRESLPAQKVNAGEDVISNSVIAVPRAVKQQHKVIGRRGGSDNFQPGLYNVLCDRNLGSFHHVGNKRFRIICENYLSRYLTATTKRDKGAMFSDEIINTIGNAGGRFLAKDKKKDSWAEVNPLRSKEKVGHTLRRAAMLMACPTL